MKRMKRNRRKSDSRGFSLVEVLLAIVILGLVAAPILQIFVTSAQINNRSRKIMAATDVANLTMECLTSMKFDEEIKTVFTEPASSPRIDSLAYTSTAQDLGTSHGTLELFESHVVTNCTGHVGKKVLYNSIMGDQCLGLAMPDVEYNGFTFDMIIWFESNKEGSDAFYTYDVVVEVFDSEDGVVEDADGNKSTTTVHYAEKLVIVNGAVVNK